MAADYSDNQKSNNVLSCTLKMLQHFECTSESVQYKCRSVGLIETVARVKELSESSLRYDILLEDVTGTLQAHLYKKQTNGKDSSLSRFQYKDNAYALIYGNFRKSQEAPVFIISSITNVNNRTDINHFLSVALYGFLILYKPKIEKTDIPSLILQTLSTLPKDSKGYNVQTITQLLPTKYPISQIEDVLNDLLVTNQIKNGCNWQHYKLHQ